MEIILKGEWAELTAAIPEAKTPKEVFTILGREAILETFEWETCSTGIFGEMHIRTVTRVPE